MDGLLRLRLALKYTEQSTSDYSCREEYVTQMAPSPTPIPSFFHRNSGHPLLCPPPHPPPPSIAAPYICHFEM